MIVRLHSMAPLVLSTAGTIVAGFESINWAGATSVISGIGLAVGGAFWFLFQKRKAAFVEMEAAKLEVYTASEAAKLQVYETSERAKLKLATEAEEGRLKLATQAAKDKLELERQAKANELRLLKAASEAKLKIQANEDAANEGSLSAEVEHLQRTLELSLKNQEELRTLADHQSEMIKVLTDYSHQANHEARNNANAVIQNLEASKMEIQESLDKVLAANADTKQKAEKNAIDIAQIKGGSHSGD